RTRITILFATWTISKGQDTSSRTKWSAIGTDPRRILPNYCSSASFGLLRLLLAKSYRIRRRYMFQFGGYPIYVVYSLNRQKAVEPIWRQHSREMARARASAVEGLKALNTDRFRRQAFLAAQSERMIYATWDWQLVEDLESKYSTEIR